MCEAGPLTPELDAGSRAVADLVDGLRELAHEVVVYAESQHDIAAETARFDPHVVVISRPGLFVRLQPKLAGLGIPLVYWAHDLHFVRVGLQGAFDAGLDARAAMVLRMVEQQCFTSADLAVLPTRDEVDRLAVEFPTARAMAVNYFAMPQRDAPLAPPTALHLVFVGGDSHAPNRDGIEWFIDQVWPAVVAAHLGARLTILGRWTRPGSNPIGVDFAGVLSDSELDSLLSTATAGIAPLRFGAGMKRKTLHYLSLGLPVVGTAFSVEGLTGRGSRHGDDGAVPGVIIATTAEEWVDAVAQLDESARWRELSVAGAAFVREEFSFVRFRDGLTDVLAAVTRAH